MASKGPKKPWIDRRCCDWDTFLTSLIAAAQRRGFPLLLVNWCEARRYWRKHACTGAEVIQMQYSRELNEALYNGYGEPPGGDGGSGPATPRKPSPIKPVTLA